MSYITIKSNDRSLWKCETNYGLCSIDHIVDFISYGSMVYVSIQHTAWKKQGQFIKLGTYWDMLWISKKYFYTIGEAFKAHTKKKEQK